MTALDEDAAALSADPAARRRLVDEAMLEVLLPRAVVGARPAAPASRRWAPAAAAVVLAGAALVLALLRAPTPGAGPTGVELEPRARADALASGDGIALRDGAAVLAARARPLRVEAAGRITIEIQPGGRCRVRVAAAAPDAAIVEVSAGSARVTRGAQIVDVGAGDAFTIGARDAVLRLGPRVVGAVETVAGRDLVVGGRHYRLSVRVEIAAEPRVGARVALTVIGADEVLVVGSP